MNLDKTILTSILYYPTISPTREAILSNLFFTVGNGYHWVDGELICDEDSGLEGVDPVQNQIEWARSCAENYGLDVERHIERWLSKVVPIIETADDRVRAGFEHKFQRPFEDIEYPMDSSHIYQICNYSHIHRVPDDVKDDWLLGALEAIELVLEMAKRPCTTRSSYSEEESARHLVNNLDEVRRAKENLVSRFGARLVTLGYDATPEN